MNPHVPCGTQDFKSCASASSATPASGGRPYGSNDLRRLVCGTDACIVCFVTAICPRGDKQRVLGQVTHYGVVGEECGADLESLASADLLR